MSVEQKTSHRGFTIITVLERLSKGRARLSAKVLASDEDHKRRLGGKKLLQAKRWFDHFADDLAAPVIAGLKHTIDLELAAAAKAAPKTPAKPTAAKPAKAAKPGKAVKAAKPEKVAKATKADKPKKAAKPGKTAKTAAATKLAQGPRVGNGAPAAVGAANGVASETSASRARPVASGSVAKTRKRAAPSAPVGTPAPKPLKTTARRSTT
ncbi:hypothetical protein PI93_011805 [Pandoraea fibrosis]|uniref:Transcriptional regulator n=1 Tax=Pandoraea fibrosis TaxID=1891094 RepID=A0ABX6HSM6_9BURK|nr:hypothetical protein [Pandoraea fibrosis]QHE93196.1 hypothetical protein PJ20_016195 [Pandoraea fibrosis]QHF13245.1 hypothetical protein PI93_011805 [Pandoraea fibrosis]